MCGLYGFSGKTPANIDKLKFLMFINQERGKDSVGYYACDTTNLDKEKNSVIQKFKGKPEDVLIDKDLNIPSSNLFIGHVRAATSGSVSVENAHPFKQGNIVLAMNGTLSNHWSLATEYKVDHTKIHVDSDALCAMLNATQNKEPLTKIIGGCAIIYTDTNTNKMYCYRNSDRPLYRGQIEESMYISSLENSLTIIGCENIKEFKENVLYEIVNGKVEKCYSVKRAVLQPVKNDIERNSPKVVLSMDEDLIFQLLIYHTTNKELVGKYLRPLASIKNYNCTGNLNPVKYYKVVDYDKDHAMFVYVIDDNNEKVSVSKWAFHEHCLLFSTNGYGRALVDIFYVDKNGNSTGNLACNKGDLLVIEKIRIKQQELEIYDLVNGNKVTVSQTIVRPIGNKEAEIILEADKLSSDTNKEIVVYESEPEITIEDLKPDPKNVAGSEDSTNYQEELFPEKKVETPLVPNTIYSLVSDFKDQKQLCDYTLESILDIITDIKELTFGDIINRKIDEIEELIINYSKLFDKLKSKECLETEKIEK